MTTTTFTTKIKLLIKRFIAQIAHYAPHIQSALKPRRIHFLFYFYSQITPISIWRSSERSIFPRLYVYFWSAQQYRLIQLFLVAVTAASAAAAAHFLSTTQSKTILSSKVLVNKKIKMRQKFVVRNKSSLCTRKLGRMETSACPRIISTGLGLMMILNWWMHKNIGWKILIVHCSEVNVILFNCREF